MNRLQIRDMARKRLGEVSGVFWEDTELNDWINQAGRDIAFKTKSLRDNDYFDTVEDQSDYVPSQLFDDILSIEEVYFKVDGTTWRKLEPISSRQEMDIRFPGWLSADSAVPYAYYHEREQDLLVLYPAPDADSEGTNYGRVFFTKAFASLTTDTGDGGTPSIPEPLHLAMVDWVVSLGYETRGYGDKANDAMTKYDKKLQDYKVERRREKEDDDIVMRSYRRCR